MKASLLLFLCLVFLLSSCGSITYLQYYKTNSTNTVREDNAYVFENDSVKITYTFWANGGVMSFSIFNKMDKPLYIDWKRSSCIINFANNFYYNDSLANQGYILTSIAFIPPKTQIEQKLSDIITMNVKDWKNFETQHQVRNDSRKKETKIFVKAFTKDNSPVIFRNFLTLSDKQDFQNTFSIDNFFYISELQAMDVRNFRSKTMEDTWEYFYQKGTDFYLEK